MPGDAPAASATADVVERLGSLRLLIATLSGVAETAQERRNHATWLATVDDARAEIGRLLARAEAAERHLAVVDAVLARRPALADIDSRAAKIERACRVAGQKDAADTRAQRAEAALREAREVIATGGFRGDAITHDQEAALLGRIDAALAADAPAEAGDGEAEHG